MKWRKQVQQHSKERMAVVNEELEQVRTFLDLVIEVNPFWKPSNALSGSSISSIS